ncbi:hypothetical protein DFQ27_001048, partial [Actinomortierella ambigua]
QPRFSADITITTARATSTSLGVWIKPGTRAYQGFATKWIEAKGNYLYQSETCCTWMSPPCATRTESSTLYTVNFPRTDGAHLDGVTALCTGEGERQDCSSGGRSNMDECRESDTLIAGDTLKGCTNNLCSDASRILVSDNNANKVAIHTNGNMCVYGTRADKYMNTWCAGKSFPDGSKGPFYGRLERDGNFCLYTKAGSNYYCTGSTGLSNGAYRMVM